MVLNTISISPPFLLIWVFLEDEKLPSQICVTLIMSKSMGISAFDKVLLCPTVQNTRWSLLRSHLTESAALAPDRVLEADLSAVLTVSVHCTRVNTTPLPCGYPNKRRYRKSDTCTPGTPKNALLRPTSSDEFHFLKLPKQQQQLETPYTPREPVGMLHTQTVIFNLPIPKAQATS